MRGDTITRGGGDTLSMTSAIKKSRRSRFLWAGPTYAEPTTRPRVYNPSAAQLLVIRGLSLGMLLALTILVSIGAGSVVKAFRD